MASADAPTPQRAASAEERERLREAPSFVLLKRGLFWRPDAKGYTGILSEAGRYSEEDARGHAGDGTTFMPAGEAPKFSSACWEDVKLKVVERELTEALDRITAAEARAEEAEAEIGRIDEALRLPAEMSDGERLARILGQIEDAQEHEGDAENRADAATADRDRLTTELAEARADAETVSSLAGKLEADRDRLADEVARLRFALTDIAEYFEEHDEGSRHYDVRWAFHSVQNIAARALTATGGTTDGQA